jgi:putative nucleotidyltransferase with HDIG domain
MTTPHTGTGPNPVELATSLIEHLVAALVNVRIYAPNHPRVQASLVGVQRTLHELATVARTDPIQLGWAEDLMIFQQRPVLGASLSASRLIDLLRQWGAGGIELHSEATGEQFNELFSGMVARPRPGEDYQALNGRLLERNCPHVRLLAPLVAVDAPGTGPKASPTRMHVAVRFYQAVVDLLQDITVSVCRGGRIDFGPVKSQAEVVLKRLEQDSGPLLGLARQDQYDSFTFGHSVRVAVLALHFARTLTTDRELLIRIGVAAVLHDVGKALVPFELLHAQRRLTAEEQQAVNRHAQLGAELLLDHHDSDPMAISAAFGHHRTKNGGYPQTLHDYQASMVTEIIKICDVYEALTAARPYKQPMSPVRAYRVMLAMQDRFDQALLRRFIEVNGIFPIGQQVALSTGELALVQEQGQNPMQPVVTVTVAADGRRLGTDEQQVIDLADIACCGVRRIIAEALSTPAPEQALTG